MELMNVFIGFDKREAAVYHVCVQSIIEHCAEPNRLAFHPVAGERRDGSNDFVYARFLVPYYSGWRGTALFLDGDMVVRADVAELFRNARLDKGVELVQHADYTTRHPTKYLGNSNADYPRKNWSSVMLWNCSFWPNRMLTPEYVAKATGKHLHRFQWLRDDQIGSLPAEWNRLVLEQDVQVEDKLRHFTIGAPCFHEYADCPGADEWWQTYARAIAPLEP
jgi:lipopolysaccharide biosynthesis glycosyltransferase